MSDIIPRPASPEAQGFAVELVDVTKRFGDVRAVDGVTLRIPDGQFYSLLGPSGCGKTTCLRLIAGFETPSTGEIWIGGRRQENTPAFQRPVNTVFQSYALFPHMTVYENVAFGLEMQKVPPTEIRRRVLESLEMIRLPGLETRRPKQLSGGQQQRVALARALVNRPKLLLLDEPLGALDLKLRRAMQLELKDLQTRVGITFLYVTHDQEEALTMSDQIAVMERGKVLQIGTPSEIYETPRTRFVADFIGETNLVAGTVVAEEGEVVRVEGSGLEIRAAHRDRLAPGSSVWVAIRPEKIRLTRDRPAGANAFEARVESLTYVGKDSEYGLLTPTGLHLRARTANVEPGAPVLAEPGQAVWAQWSPEAALLLSE
jgi:spermidine/putrescine transport system ATP-binding protein